MAWRKFGNYKVSDKGEVKNRKGLILKRVYRNGYPCVNLYGCPDAKQYRWGSKRKHYLIAHLVLEAFVRPRPTRAMDGTGNVVYKDGNCNNCKLKNIKWG